MYLTQDSATKLISNLGMSDIPVMAHRPTMHKLPPDWFHQYKQLCHKFMLSLTDSIDTLGFMNFDTDEFMGLITGRVMPPNLSIRFRIPLMWGGELSIDNMFLCLTFPHSHNMDRFIICQSGNDIIWLPNPPNKVYYPVRTLGGGDGGNGTEDRITETIASQIASERDI